MRTQKLPIGCYVYAAFTFPSVVLTCRIESYYKHSDSYDVAYLEADGGQTFCNIRAECCETVEDQGAAQAMWELAYE